MRGGAYILDYEWLLLKIYKFGGVGLGGKMEEESQSECDWEAAKK